MTNDMEILHAVLQNGTIELKGQFMLGSNYTFLVEVSLEGRVLPAVYKPMGGEQPLWDFPPSSLAGREVAAYLVSEALEFHFVPYTLLREGPLGPGSLQQFIEYNPNLHYFTFKPADLSKLRTVAVFDLLINNADRKGSHVLLQKRSRRIFLIDHGLCFHDEDKLRTVIWDFAGETFSDEIMDALQKLKTKLTPVNGLKSRLGKVLLTQEVAALERRLEHLLAHPVFPEPPRDRRAYPYPPV